MSHSDNARSRENSAESKSSKPHGETTIVAITNDAGDVVEPEWLAKSEAVHRQLRPDLDRDYAAAMKRVFADGARMCVATRGSLVVGVAVHRTYTNTCDGLHMYVDDLVTDERERSSGVGRALLDHLQHVAQRAGCKRITLDSGTQRQQAHKFYFREGFFVVGFHFRKALD